MSKRHRNRKASHHSTKPVTPRHPQGETPQFELLQVWPPKALDLESSPCKIERWIIPIQNELVIGREIDPFSLQDGQRLPHHAVLRCQPDGTALLTASSAGATSVCRKNQWITLKPEEAVRLQPGQLFLCGSRILQYRYRTVSKAEGEQ